MVQHVHFGFVEELTGPFVEQKSILLPAIPQTLYDVHELGRACVARVVVKVLVAIEVFGLRLGPRGDDVPACATLAYKVERRELAGNMKRFIVGGGGGSEEANPLGHYGEGGQQRHGVELGDLITRARPRTTWNTALPDADTVGKKDDVAHAACGTQGAAPIVFKSQGAIGWHIGMSPGGGMITQAPDRHPKMHLSAGHGVPSGSRRHQGCGPQGAAVSSFTSCDMTSGRKREAKPSTKSLLAKTPAQCLRRSASSSNFHICTS